ncbi:MAG: hypothetical protein AB7K24_33515, partial [Gemmataceae bacterium]
NTVASRLLERMPVLEELAIPEPPRDLAFFEEAPHALRKLSVFDTDYDSFVIRLGKTRRFPKLQELSLRESFRTDVNARVPAGDYLPFFQSGAFPALRGVTLAQVDLTNDHSPLLRATKLGRQLCRLQIESVKSWCDRPVMHAPAQKTDPFTNIKRWLPPKIQTDWITWNDRTVPKLAQAAAMECSGGQLDSKRLAILADALEEAGCTNHDLLAHLRCPLPHLSGCWAVGSLTACTDR